MSVNDNQRINPEKELKDAEKKFKFILDNSNDLISLLNRDFIHELINE